MINEKIANIENDPTLRCTMPWTTLDEQSVYGDFKTCCWLRNTIGRIPKDSHHDFMELWNCPSLLKLREVMASPDRRVDDFCSPWCGVLGQKEDYVKQLGFWHYDDAEYASFDQKFRDNRERTIAAIANRTIRLDTRPLRLKLFPSLTCNLNCPMCSRDKEHKPAINEHYLTDIYRLMPYLEDLCIFGGEPFACEITKKIVFSDELKSYPQIHFSTVTNGTLLDDEMQERLSRLRLGWFNIGLDSCREKTYEMIRYGANFSQTLKNITTFAAKAKNGTINIKILLLSFVIQQCNFEEITDFVDFAHNLEAEPVFTLVSGSSELRSNIQAVRENIEKGIRRAEQINAGPARRSLARVLHSLPLYERNIKLKYWLDLIPLSLGKRQVKQYFKTHNVLRQRIRKVVDCCWRV
jgi:pyruvate-formate lyase-activating enzyme